VKSSAINYVFLQYPHFSIIISYTTSHSLKNSVNPLSLRADNEQRCLAIFAIHPDKMQKKFFDDKSSWASIISYSNSLKTPWPPHSPFHPVQMLPKVATGRCVMMSVYLFRQTCTCTPHVFANHDLKKKKGLRQPKVKTGSESQTRQHLFIRWFYLAHLTE
jgi:hypothetical protein